MRTTRGYVAVFLLLGLVDVGCINVNAIQSNGGFACNENAAQKCPDGYTCEFLTSTCQRISRQDAAGDFQSFDTTSPFDAHGEGAPEVDGGPDGGACVMPVPGCTADTGKRCDPVCQTGCTGCTEKCSANTMGTLTCNVPLATRPRALGEICDISSLNGATQTDNCAPGLVCLNDACGARCYGFCKTDADCPMSTCTRDVGTVSVPPGTPTGIKVCDVQATTCNPINNGQPTGCGADVQGCYVASTLRDETICDCPFQAGGTNTSCSISRDCFPGLTCVDVNGTGNALCRPVCGVGANDCMGKTCVPLNGSTKYGYCN